MKESIEELIEVYKKKVETLKILHKQATDNLSKVRLDAKRSAYDSIIQDLKLNLKDHEENCARSS